MSDMPDYGLMNMLDDKTRLAGSNRMELLLFSLGGAETFGINVFKVREVCETLPITRTPNMPPGVEGIISLRGAILPVLDLARCLCMDCDARRTKLIITEFSGHTQAFLVHDVDRIVRVDWESVRSPQTLATHQNSLITALTELENGRLVSILDVEQILGNVVGDQVVPPMEKVKTDKPTSVFFADDSSLARRKIQEVLDQLGLPYQSAINGREAWEKLQSVASRTGEPGSTLRDQLGLIMVDAEMPEMDGYVLTKHIKNDPRFRGIPILMHSSLSSMANKKLGQQVGVDAYVAKFHPDELADSISGLLLAPKEQA